MFQPFVCSPYEAFSKEEVERKDVVCACGKSKLLKDTNLVWVAKQGEDPEYYAICNQRCYTAHVTLGHA